MPNKILFLGQGSPNDPGFKDVFVEGKPFRDYMSSRGIKVLDGVVESCHGCYDLMTKYSQQLQEMAERGDRVVGVLQGGKLFGLPSIQATQTTFPIISVPLDLVAYASSMVPSGHAAIATVGVDPGRTDREKAKALKLAERILNLDRDEVNIICSDKTNEEKLAEKLYSLFGIRNVGTYINPALSLVYGTLDEMKKVPHDSFVVRADSDENLKNWEYLSRAQHRHHLADWNEVLACQVRGLDNSVMFAAKIFSLQKPELREKLEEIARKKRTNYSERDLLKEVGI